MITDAIRQSIPPLVYAKHKGEAGRVGIIGGSDDFTGAPYYAAIASLRTVSYSYAFKQNSDFSIVQRGQGVL